MYLLPSVKRALESPRWDPVTDHENAELKLYELQDAIVMEAR